MSQIKDVQAQIRGDKTEVPPWYGQQFIYTGASTRLPRLNESVHVQELKLQYSQHPLTRVTGEE